MRLKKLAHPSSTHAGRNSGHAISLGGLDELGAALVEFSIIALLLFALLLAIVQFGITYNRQQGLHAAAREGARLASLGDAAGVDDLTAAVEARVRSQAPPWILDPEQDLSIELGPDDWCRDTDGDGIPSADQKVTVAVSINSDSLPLYRADIPGFASILPDLSTEATFLCENVRL